MSIYILIGIILFFFSVLNISYKKNVRASSKMFVFSFFLLFFLSAFRENIGVDYLSYKSIFSLESGQNMSEIGFVETVSYLNQLGFNYKFFFFIFSLATVFLYLRFIVKYSPYIFFSIFIYYCVGNYYFGGFNAIRQSLAIGIFINCLALIERKQHKEYLLIILFTTFFVHYSVIILYLLYYILRKNYNLFIYILVMIGVLGLNHLIIPLIEMSLYAIYLKMADNSVPITYYFMFVCSVMIFFYSQTHPEWKIKNIIFVNLNFIAFLFFCLIIMYNDTPLVMVINRLIWYFTIIYVVLIPKIIYQLKLQNNKILVIGAISLFLLSWCILALRLNGESNAMVPYQSMFNL